MATRFARISMLAPFAAAATGFSCLYGKRSPSVCSAKPNDKSGNEIVAIYLTKQSREQLKRYLERSPLMKEILPIQDPSLSPSVITILRSKDRKDTFEYEPVFGERAAFRLKSIIATKEGRIAGFGLCSIMSGPFADEIFEPSVVLEPESPPNPTTSKNSTESMDLPTRLLLSKPPKDCVDRPVWEGTTKAVTIVDRKYPSSKVKVYNIPFDKQIVVDGYICSNEFVNADGVCEFDRSSLVLVGEKNDQTAASEKPVVSSKEKGKPPSGSGSVDAQVKVKVDANADAPPASAAPKECPVCAYMKAGPCKAEFVEWDKCLQSLETNPQTEQEAEADMSACMPPTLTMMQCMRKYEYYDIMTAGTLEKYEALAEAEAQAGASSKTS